MLFRSLPPSDLSLIQPLFERVFKHPINLDLLRWKYAEGRGESWVAYEEGCCDPILHCGLIFRNILLAGEPCRAAQLVDLMAAPKRTGLSRRDSPFSLLMEHILEGLPRDENPEGVAFGFPSGRAMRLGEHTRVYLAVEDWMELEFGAISSKLGPRLRHWSADTADLQLVDQLWKKMAKDFDSFSLGIRDSNYLRHRYLEHPEKKYTIWVIESRWFKAPIGIAVIRPDHNGGEVLDLIAEWEDMPEVILALRRYLNMLQGQQIFKLMLTSRFAQQLRPFVDSCQFTQFRIMANPLTPEKTLNKLKSGWWLTGGDTDYR